MPDLLDLAVIGAGPIGILSAALAGQAGHRVGIWAPRGSPTDPGTRTLRCSGALQADVKVEILQGPEALAGSKTVLIAIPGTAYHGVLETALPHLRSGQEIVFSGALSLAQLWLHEKATARGIRPTIAAWGTTLGTAYRTAPLHAHVTMVRPRLGITALPQSAMHDLLARCAALFGDRFEALASPLAALLSNINPVAHAGQVIPNLTRIEKAEDWQLFENFTPAGARIATAIDAERLAIAQAFGMNLRQLAEHYRISYQVEGADVAAVAQVIQRSGLGVAGPTDTAHRYIDEDVPFGLVVLQRLGIVSSTPTPILDATVRVLSCALNQPFMDQNPILAEFDLDGETCDSLLQRFP